jgi:quercetin 2,3-dioxygenase
MSTTPTAAGTRRTVQRVADTQVVLEGAGVPVRRALPSRTAPYASVDPFLLLDHVQADSRTMGEGFPPHPHRGFEIITYLLAGGAAHSDSEGNQGVVHAGGLQRITAGRGIWHGEGPGGEPGPMEGLQLWINLPRRDKGIPPAYQGVEGARLPQARIGDATVKTLVGEGSPTTLHTPAVYYDVTVPAGGQTELPLPDGYQGFAYVLEGQGQLGENRQAVGAGQLAVLGQDGALPAGAGAEGLRFVLAAGTPYHEAPRWNGPYVD